MCRVRDREAQVTKWTSRTSGNASESAVICMELQGVGNGDHIHVVKTNAEDTPEVYRATGSLTQLALHS